MTTKKLGSLALAFAAFAVACSDPTTPTRALLGDAPSLAVSNVSGYPFPIADGAVQLCKTSNVAGDFDFDATGPAGIDTDPDITIPAGGGTVCTIIYTSALTRTNAGLSEGITITETTNANLASIAVIRYLDPVVAYTAPELVDSDAGSTATIRINNDMARRVTFTNTTPQLGGQGCTPGFWKNNADKHDASQWGAIDPNATFTSVFGANDLPAGTTLLEALNLGGGGVNALARHAVAAYLNSQAGAPNYAFTTAQVIAKVQAAMASNNYNAAKDELATENERGCPLSQNG